MKHVEGIKVSENGFNYFNNINIHVENLQGLAGLTKLFKITGLDVNLIRDPTYKKELDEFVIKNRATLTHMSVNNQKSHQKQTWANKSKHKKGPAPQPPQEPKIEDYNSMPRKTHLLRPTRPAPQAPPLQMAHPVPNPSTINQTHPVPPPKDVQNLYTKISKPNIDRPKPKIVRPKPKIGGPKPNIGGPKPNISRPKPKTAAGPKCTVLGPKSNIDGSKPKIYNKPSPSAPPPIPTANSNSSQESRRNLLESIPKFDTSSLKKAKDLPKPSAPKEGDLTAILMKKINEINSAMMDSFDSDMDSDDDEKYWTL